MKHSKLAFTLAEILIALTIIGVIAALTLPTLQTNMQNQAFETQLRKFHNQMTTATKTYMVKNNLRNLSSKFGHNNGQKFDEAKFLDNIDNFVTSTFEIVGAYDDFETSCFAGEYKTLNGKPFYISKWSSKDKCYKLADGTVFHIGNPTSSSVAIDVDLNGLKKPNTEGLDFWHMYIVLKTGAVDGEGVGSLGQNNHTLDEFKNNCLTAGSTTTDYSCFSYVLRNNFKFDW